MIGNLKVKTFKDKLHAYPNQKIHELSRQDILQRKINSHNYFQYESNNIRKDESKG